MKRHRLAVPIASLALSAVAILAMAGAAFACSQSDLKITAGSCSGDVGAATRTWTVTNSYVAESIAWDDNASFSSPTTLTPKSAGTWTVQTASTVGTLYVRFVNDTGVSIHKAWDGGECPVPTPTPTPTSEVQGETATPVASVTTPPTSTGSGSNSSSTPIFAVLICLAFGGLGLAAVEAQRRSIRG